MLNICSSQSRASMLRHVITGQLWPSEWSLFHGWWVWALHDHHWWVTAGWWLLMSACCWWWWIHPARHLWVSKLWMVMLCSGKVLLIACIAMTLWSHHAPLIQRLRPARVLAAGMRWAWPLIEGRCGVLGRKVMSRYKALHSRNTPSWWRWKAGWHWRLVPQTEQLFGGCRLQLLSPWQPSSPHKLMFCSRLCLTFLPLHNDVMTVWTLSNCYISASLDTGSVLCENSVSLSCLMTLCMQNLLTHLNPDWINSGLIRK